MRPRSEFSSFGGWYAYLINDFIPLQGNADMETFIELGWSPDAYIMWKAGGSDEKTKEQAE